MRDLLRKARTRVGAAVIGAGLLAVGGTATAAVVATSPGTDEVSDVSTVNTQPVETAAPTTAVADVPVDAESPVQEAPADTVEAVTEPEAVEQAPEAEAEVVDPESIGTTGPDGNYTPAPPRQNPGEPPAAPGFGSSGATAEKLPSEEGYVPPPQG